MVWLYSRRLDVVGFLLYMEFSVIKKNILGIVTDSLSTHFMLTEIYNINQVKNCKIPLTKSLFLTIFIIIVQRYSRESKA